MENGGYSKQLKIEGYVFGIPSPALTQPLSKRGLADHLPKRIDHFQGHSGSKNGIASGKRLHSYGNSQFFMGKSTISMGHFQ
jgi:hypothetical protein